MKITCEVLLSLVLALSSIGFANANGTDYHALAVKAATDQKALAALESAAEQGNAEAQSDLGLLYDHGQGLPQNYAKATYWYRKAAGQGYAEAQYNLGLLYALGLSVPKDYAKAAYWWRKVADQGSAEAQSNLGAFYAQGRGVPQNYVLSAQWWILANASGGAKAAKALTTLESIMTPAQIAEAQRKAGI
jgi:TPR repeat protein